MIQVDELGYVDRPTGALLTNVETGDQYKIDGWEMSTVVDNLEYIHKSHLLKLTEYNLEIANKDNEKLHNELNTLRAAYQEQAEQLNHPIQYQVCHLCKRIIKHIKK